MYYFLRKNPWHALTEVISSQSAPYEYKYLYPLPKVIQKITSSGMNLLCSRSENFTFNMWFLSEFLGPRRVTSTISRMATSSVSAIELTKVTSSFFLLEESFAFDSGALFMTMLNLYLSLSL